MYVKSKLQSFFMPWDPPSLGVDCLIAVVCDSVEESRVNELKPILTINLIRKSAELHLYCKKDKNKKKKKVNRNNFAPL